MRISLNRRSIAIFVAWSAALSVCAQSKGPMFGPQGTSPANLPTPPPGIAKGTTDPAPRGGVTTPETQRLDIPKLNPQPDSTIKPGKDIEDNESSTIKLPNIQVTDLQRNAYLVEDPIPKRLPILADDPDSAWWESNPRVAFQLAQRQQRPLLLLFTTMTNAKCQKLSEEVFATRTFNDYVKENLIICYLNYPRSITDAPMSMRIVKEQFKVSGYPNVLIFDPDGSVTQEITGYRTGRPVDYFNQLKTAIQPELAKIEDRKKKLRSYGFRNWENQHGRYVFGKFVQRDDTMLMLLGPHLEKWTLPIAKLSQADQTYAETFPSIDEIVAGQKAPPLQSER